MGGEARKLFDDAQTMMGEIISGHWLTVRARERAGAGAECVLIV